MSPTLADVYMITGLDITGSVQPWNFKGSSRQTGVKPGNRYKNYILKHMKDNPLGVVEYRAFLNMWLCRFVFCGKANEPTLNHIAMASHLASGNRLPLGKFFLGSVYHMLHQTVTQMYTSQRIACVNGPWWFVQMWLQLHMHQIVGVDLNSRFFPLSLEKKTPKPWTRASNPRRAAHQRSARFGSEFSLDLLLVPPYDPVLHVFFLSSPSLDLLFEEVIGTEDVPEYISSDSSLEAEDATPEQRTNH
jgi:hypothetical protein